MSSVYAPDIIRFALMFRYTSVQWYKLLLDEFRLPSLSLLRKIVTGDIDAAKSSKLLKDEEKISSDICLIFDEMYLQKCEEYTGGQLIGTATNGKLYKGIVSFMIIGVKQNTPYIIKSVPEIKIHVDWLKNQIIGCLKVLTDCRSKVRMIISDNHSCNTSAYHNILSHFNTPYDNLYFMYESQKIYLCFDTVHLIKSIRNNLLNNKRFIFPAFTFEKFNDLIHSEGGEKSWKLLHDTYEKDCTLQSNLCKAPRLNWKILHPGNNKKRVPLALAIIHETTTAAIEAYFPENNNSVDLPRLLNIWRIISNSKTQFLPINALGNAVIIADNKLEFLRSFAVWVPKWQNEKIPCFETFTLTKQTSSALTRTFLWHVALIGELLDEGYRYIFTSRFQSDLLERRFGQYRQMSGGRFLVGLRDVAHSEKIIRLKSLLKGDINALTEDIFLKKDEEEKLQFFLFNITSKNLIKETIVLSDDTREVGIYISGYIAKKIRIVLKTAALNMPLGKPKRTMLIVHT